jgi:DNA repair exonuclease SbcCD ATPase subunit
MSESQRIIKLQGENVLRLQAFACEPDGAPMVLVEGKNGAGKTTILRSIEMALCGGKAIPDEPIHKGKAKGRILMETDDYRITRTFSQKSTALLVEAKGGDGKFKKVPQSPQELLNTLTGALSFDPLSFAIAKPKEQVEMFKSALGLDFTEIDERRDQAYSDRTDANRELKKLEAQFDAMTAHRDAPEEEVSVSKLTDELAKRQAANRENEAKRNQAADMVNAAMAKQGIISDIEAADGHNLATMEENAKELDARLAAQRAAIEIFKAGAALRIEAAKKEAANAFTEAEAAEIGLVDLNDQDEAEIIDQIKNAESVNSRVRANKKYAETMNEIAEAKANADALSETITACDQAKADAISSAKLPVDGLTFDETGVKLDGLPFDQLSKALQIRISTAIGLALNPNMRIMLIRDGSLLDDGNLEVLREMAINAEAQVWIEKVSNDESVKVLIVEGNEE